MAVEEAQSLLVELGRTLVNGSMCAGLEHEKLTTVDSLGQRVSEPQRGDLVVAAERDLGRCLDMRQLGDHIVVNHRVRLSHEGVERLFRTTAYERGDLVHELRIARVKIRREAPWQDSLNDHFGDAVQSLGGALPASHDRLEESISFGPATVQR